LVAQKEGQQCTGSCPGAQGIDLVYKSRPSSNTIDFYNLRITYSGFRPIRSIKPQDKVALEMASDDSFQLYDLCVEVVCPQGSKILCGAKEGDHFTLQGEMLYLPANQGISIYSLGKISVITFGCQV
jgi:hypothetical protein